MTSLKLLDGNTYELVTNGVLSTGKELRLIFLPSEEDFETIESKFAPLNTQTIRVIDSEGMTIRSLIGYTKYKGMEKQKDYVISTETVNIGTEEDPNYEFREKTATVMIVTMSKPEVEDRVSDLEQENTIMKTAAKFSAFGFTDQQALKVKSLYPKWSSLADGTELTKQEEATKGTEITKVLGDDGLLYKVITTHKKQSDWIPGQATASIFTVINEEHAGTQEDPIPWSTNMICYNGKYYTYNGILYKCIRDSGIALQYTPDQLLDNYFQTV